MSSNDGPPGFDDQENGAGESPASPGKIAPPSHPWEVRDRFGAVVEVPERVYSQAPPGILPTYEEGPESPRIARVLNALLATAVTLHATHLALAPDGGVEYRRAEGLLQSDFGRLPVDLVYPLVQRLRWMAALDSNQHYGRIQLTDGSVTVPMAVTLSPSPRQIRSDRTDEAVLIALHPADSGP